jgi:CcmD family protein
MKLRRMKLRRMKLRRCPAQGHISVPQTLIAVVAVIVVALAVPAQALAQEFQKVEGKLADNVPAVPFVGIAYGVIWLAVLVYVLVIARGLARVNADLTELRRKVDGAGTPRK